MKPACLLALCLLLPAFGDPPVVPDGSLHDLWFKVAIKVKGKTVSHDGSEVGKASFPMTSFLRFQLAKPIVDGEAPNTLYVVEEWHEDTPGMWVAADLGETTVVCTSKDDYIVQSLEFFAESAAGSGLLNSTLLIHVKRDKQGDVTSAKLATLG